MFTKVFKNYSRRDRNLSILCISLITIVFLYNIVSTLTQNYQLKPQKNAYAEAHLTEIEYLNPLFKEHQQINRDLSTLIYSGLTKYNPESKTFEPDLATFTINNDATVYTFTLKDKLRWHDKKPVTVEDVLFTYRQVIQNKDFSNSILKSNFEGIEINITSLNSIEFKLTAPNAFFISQTDIGILPKHIYDDIPVPEIGQEFKNQDYKKIIGTGPYKFKKYQTVNKNISKLILQINKDHFLKPELKYLYFYIFKDQSSLEANLQSINAIPYANIKHPDFKAEEYLLPQYQALFFNLDNPLLNDRVLRVILKRATNPNKFLENLNQKQAISRPFFQFEAINEIRVENLSELESIFIQNGYQKNNRNIYEKNGTPIELYLVAQEYQNEYKNTETQTLLQNLQNIYQTLGIKINISTQSNEQFSQTLATRNYDLLLVGHNLTNNFDAYSFWHSSQANPNGLNLSNYRNLSTDNLIEKLRTATQIEDRNELLIAINEKLVYDIPAIFLYTDIHIFLFDNQIKNRHTLKSYAFSSDRFYNLENWEKQPNS